MTERHPILDDQEFWTKLEYDASRWIESSENKELRRFWIDGFAPEAIKNTRNGAAINGIAWVGEGGRIQHQYEFVLSAPQELLQLRHDYVIARLFLDVNQRSLSMELRRSGSAT